jgi:capsular polysaccharide biosynthesis protein
MTDVKAIFAAFESLGDNCEFGIAQRHAGIEPLGLLRFAGTAHLPSITAAIESGFDRFGEDDDVELFGQQGGYFGVHIKSFHIIYATATLWRGHDTEIVRRKEVARIGILKRKLLEDLEDATKIFVRKSRRETFRDIEALSNAMRRFGPNKLLWVTEADQNHANGTVEVLSEGIIAGRIAKFAPTEDVPSLALPDWIDLCKNCLETVRTRSPAQNGHAPERNAAPVATNMPPASDALGSPKANDAGSGKASEAIDGTPKRSAVLQQILNLFESPSYLEIGVDSGLTFHSLSAFQKVAVDPDFKFTPPANTMAAEYYAVTSDEYFATHCPANKFFDVVYIDGLHTFEQTLRDMLNAVLRLKPGGVVVIDDILPVSYHASLPDLRVALLVRDHLAGNASPQMADNTWMGDVYKLAFFIQTFMQQLSYATVQETLGQMIVWQSPRQISEIAERRILDVSLLSFSDSIASRDVFRIRPIDFIIDSIRKSRSEAKAIPSSEPAVDARPRAPTYVSCNPDLLYPNGAGFFEGPEGLAELRLNSRYADFITDLGELFPSQACIRKIDSANLVASSAFLEKLLDHYRRVDAICPRVAAVRVFRLTDIYLNRNSLHHISDGKVVTVYETGRPIDRRHSSQPLWTPEQLTSLAVRMRCDHPSIYLGSAGSPNYGHWLIDDLTRAEALGLVGKHADSRLVDFFLPGFSPAMNKVREESLAVVRSGRLQGATRFVPHDQVLHFDELYFVTPASFHPATKSAAACQRLREHVRSVLATRVAPDAARARRIYIQRGASYDRHIVNEAEVINEFRKFGFVAVNFDGMTFAEQVAAVSNASIVAGCMGAAMTNTVFCEPGTVVLQLAPEGWIETFYWDLANVCGHSYIAVFGSVTDPTIEPHMSSFAIDLGKLSEALKRTVL